MIATAPIAKKLATANIAGYVMGIYPGATLYSSPRIMPIIKVLNPVTNEEIHSIQTSIDARSLNISGISLPPDK